MGPKPLELSPQAIDHYVKETQNLSRIPFFRVNKTARSELHVDPSPDGEFLVSQIVHEFTGQEPEIYLQTHYHLAMLQYIYNFPQRALELSRLPQWRDFTKHWIAILDYCKQKKILHVIGLNSIRCKALLDQIAKIHNPH